jgi:hypothetical protein
MCATRPYHLLTLQADVAVFGGSRATYSLCGRVAMHLECRSSGFFVLRDGMQQLRLCLTVTSDRLT